jgi:hypothetical protein
MFKHLSVAFGWVLIAIGLVVFPLPIPLGLIMILAGLALVAKDSVAMQDWIRKLRRDNPRANAKIKAVRPRLPNFLGRVIDMTDPDDPDQTGTGKDDSMDAAAE